MSAITIPYVPCGNPLCDCPFDCGAWDADRRPAIEVRCEDADRAEQAPEPPGGAR